MLSVSRAAISKTFALASKRFSAGLNSATNADTNQEAGVLAPTAVLEPAAFGMLLADIAVMMANTVASKCRY